MSTATYVGTDLTTKGAWIGVYGTAGRILPLSPSDSVVLPAWLTSASLVQGTRYDYVVNGGTPQGTVDADPRAPANVSTPPARSGRIWYQASGGVILSVVPTGSSPYRCSLYLVDWDNNRNGCTASVLDASAGDAALDSRSLSQADYRAGGWLTWTCTGSVKLKVVQVAPGGNAIVYGLFFDSLASPSPGRLICFGAGVDGLVSIS